MTALHKKKHQLSYLIHEVNTPAYLIGSFIRNVLTTGQREGTCIETTMGSQ